MTIPCDAGVPLALCGRDSCTTIGSYYRSPLSHTSFVNQSPTSAVRVALFN